MGSVAWPALRFFHTSFLFSAKIFSYFLLFILKASSNETKTIQSRPT